MASITVGSDNTVPQSFVVRVGSIELAEFTRVSPGEGLDPAGGEWRTPQFAESPLDEGGEYAGDAVTNKQLVDPMILHASSKDALHELIVAIEREIRKPGVLIEWRDAGAGQSTFLDLEAGRLEHDFNFRRSQKNHANATLRLWVRPYGHAAQERLVAQATAQGALCVADLAADALDGDVPALIDASVTTGLSVPAPGRVVGVSVLPASYEPRFPAPSIGDLMAGSSVVGASGAAASQILTIPVPTASPAIACKVTLPAPDLYEGSHRVVALARQKLLQAVAVRAFGPEGEALGATQVITATEGFQLVDLGVLRGAAPARDVAKITLQAGGVSGPAASTLASPGLHLNEVYVLPERSTALVTEAALDDLSSLTEAPAAGDVYRLDGVRRRSFRETAAGGLAARLGALQRGAAPRLVAADAQRVAAFAAPVTPGAVNGQLDLAVSARERFTFAR